MSEEPAPAESRELVPAQELRSLAAFLFNLIEAQITRADTKAGLVIAADSVLVTGALFQAHHRAIALVFDGSAAASGRLVGALMVLMFGALLLSIMHGLIAARPSLSVKGDDGGSLFFFSHIAGLSDAEFRETFSRLSVDQLQSSLLSEVYNTARIANDKFARIRHSIDWLIVSVVLWSLIEIVLGLFP